MVQKILGFGLGGTGIVAVLIIAGILLSTTGNSDASGLAIYAGIFIGIVFRALGIFGILIKMLK